MISWFDVFFLPNEALWEGEDVNKKYIVDLSGEERSALQQILRAGRHAARKTRWAHALLKADDGWKDEDIAQALDILIWPQFRLHRVALVYAA